MPAVRGDDAGDWDRGAGDIEAVPADHVRLVLRAAEEHLLPVYEELRRQLVKCEALHADETTLQVLHEPGKKAQAKNYMWLYRTGREDGPPIVLYKYQPGRKAEHAEKFLEGFSGYLHADGYQGYLCTPYLYYNTTR